MDGREDLHRHLARILAYEIIVHLEDAAELALEVVGRNVREVEVDAVRVVHAETHVHDDLVDGAGRDVTRHEVAVCRVHILEEVPALFLARLRVLAVDPDASALAAASLAHQAVLVGARDGRRMDLQELGVAELRTLLIDGGDGGAVADRRRRAAAVDLARAARREDDDVSGERDDLHRVHVLRDDAAADAVLVLDDADELPELVLFHAALDFPAADLLVERVEELLARRGAGEAGALVLLAAEVAEVENALRRARERHAHAVEHLDELRRGLDHALDSELVGEEVAAVDRVIEMLVDGIMLALRVHAGVDAALGAEGVGALDGAVGEEVYLAAALANLERRHEAGEAAADDDDLIFWFVSHSLSPLLGNRRAATCRCPASRYLQMCVLRRGRSAP